MLKLQLSSNEMMRRKNMPHILLISSIAVENCQNQKNDKSNCQANCNFPLQAEHWAGFVDNCLKIRRRSTVA